MPCDRSGFSDPYVIVYVKEFSEISTSFIKKTLNPVWNEEFDFKITSSELSAIDVVFKVSLLSDSLVHIHRSWIKTP